MFLLMLNGSELRWSSAKIIQVIMTCQEEEEEGVPIKYIQALEENARMVPVGSWCRFSFYWSCELNEPGSMFNVWYVSTDFVD